MAAALTTITDVKEYDETYLPLFLWEFTFTDGTWAGFATHGLSNAEHGFQYNGKNYEGRVLNGDVAAAQALTASGVTMYPSLQLELDDADRVLTQNVEIDGPGFKGAEVVLRFVFYDPTATDPAKAFSTDDLPLFLGTCITSPGITDGTVTLTVQSLLHLASGVIPGIHIQKRCPWIHPNTPEEKAEANKFESWFYNCGDTSTAAGHDHCEYTPDDCKRLGMWDEAAKIFRFGGIQADPPPTWTGKPFGGDTETRDNAKNHTLDSDFVPVIYGRGWIEPIVINMSGEANYTRMQILVCYGQTIEQIGPGYFSDSWKLSINDCVIGEAAINTPGELTRNGFWSFVSSGARDGSPCVQVGYEVSNGAGGVKGGGDPFGSMTVLYAAVLRRVTESNQLPSVQLLASGGRIPIFNSDDPTDFTLRTTRNPVWQAIDMMMWGGRSYSDLRLSTFRAVAAFADELIAANDRNGVAGFRPRFESCIVARHPRAIGEMLQGVLGSFGGYLTTTDKIELHLYGTLASEQPAPIPGSNDNIGYTVANTLGGFNGKTVKGAAGTGYLAYSFGPSNIKEVNGHSTLRRLPVSMQDEPNTFSYTFQDSQNEFQVDTLTVPDIDAINRNNGQQIVASAPFEGITTYDQAFRMGRRSLAVRLRGNPQGDPRGTWRMQFTASVKAVGLRLGHIVALSAAEFGLVKQLFRIEEIKPSLNFQEAELVVVWHNDDFYMDDYGESGFPPISGSRQESNRNPRDWQPYHKQIPALDALYHGDPAWTFGMRQWLRDGEMLTDSMIRIQGYPPITITAPMDVQPPWFTDQDLVPEAGGTLTPDRLYYVCIAVEDVDHKLSSPSTIHRVYLPAGTNRQFRIENLFWRGGGTAHVFVGQTPDRLSYCKTVVGQPDTIYVGDFAVPKTSWGPPDSKAHHYVVRWRESIHAGVFGGKIAQVMPGGTSLKIAGVSWAVNEFQNRVMSIIGDANTATVTGDYFPVVNCVIASNTADTLVLTNSGDLGALGIQAGDVIVIRTLATTFTANTIGDAKFANSTYPAGMGDEVIGREVVIRWGTGAGQGRIITAHDGTTVTVSEAFDPLPDATSIFTIEESAWQSQETAVIQASAYPPAMPPATPNFETVTVCDIAVQNWAARTLRVEVNLSDSVGKTAVDALSREIYLYETFDPDDITPGGPAPKAPNVTSATVTPVYSCPNNDSLYALQITMTLPLSDPDISHLKKIRVLNSLTGKDMLVVGQPATGWTSPITFTTDAIAQPRALQNGTATFNCENDDLVVSDTPLVVAFTVQASAVTGFTSAGETPSRFIAAEHVDSRLVSLWVDFVPILNAGIVPQSVYYLISKDGNTWTGITFQRMKAVGDHIKFASLAPGTNQNWRVAACTGALAATSQAITDANIATLFPGVQISAPFAVAALQLPPAGLITGITVPAGTGAPPYPYDAVRTDNSRYWKIPSVTVADNPAVAVPDAFYLRITAQDLDASKNPVAPEHPYAGAQVSITGQTNVFDPLMGDYGTNGLTVVRTGNIAWVRLRAYLCNRIDQTEYSFQNPLCATLQSTLDVQVSDGTIPPQSLPTPSPSPNVTITGQRVDRKYDGSFQVQVYWTPGAGATADNFVGVDVYLEDPDISNLALAPLNATVRLDGTSQGSGVWKPVRVTSEFTSPATLSLPAEARGRSIRVYLLSYGKSITARLARYNAAGATPSIRIDIPAESTDYVSGQEMAAIVTNPVAAVVEDWDNPKGAKYHLKFSYTAPDPGIPIPPGNRPFGGVLTVFEYLDGSRVNNMFLDVNHPESWVSDDYEPGNGGTYKCYFVSRDVDGRLNQIVPGVTPMVNIVITYPPAGQSTTPDVTGLTITPQAHSWQPDGTLYAVARVAWTIPSSPRYAGVEIWRVSPAPIKQLGPKVGTPVTNRTLEIIDWPSATQTWTLAAISYDTDGKRSADPNAALPARVPTATWSIGPPDTSSGIYTPNGTAGTVTTIQEPNSDGLIRMRHQISGWTNPTDNSFGGMTIARVAVGVVEATVYWDVAKGATSFVTDWEPAPTTRDWDFYFLARDQQGRRNTIIPGVTPSYREHFEPSAGTLLPSRMPKDWWDPTEFQWPAGDAGKFQALQFVAKKIYVGSILRVGGGPVSGDGQFKGFENGQVVVYNSSNLMRAWMGEHSGGGTPDNPAGHTIYGGWFSELYVGGDDPTTAPIYAKQDGTVIIGGWDIKGSRYPYISVRRNDNTEVGRIGARIGDGLVSTSDPAYIGGAWFKEFAVGGASLADWRLLARRNPTDAYGSDQVNLRNINKFTIDWPQNAVGIASNPTNAAMTFTLGLDAYVADSTNASYWKFPGLKIERSFTSHRSVLINRGLILWSPVATKLAALISYNGDQYGSDSPNFFYGSFTMMNPANGNINVIIESGQPSGDTTSAYMRLHNGSGAVNFQAYQSGDLYARGWCQADGGYKTSGGYVINASGQFISGAGVNTSAQVRADGGFLVSGGVVAIASTGHFRGQGCNPYIPTGFFAGDYVGATADYQLAMTTGTKTMRVRGGVIIDII